MFYTLRELFGSLGDWGAQVLHLAYVEMRKRARGTALGWVWVFAKPAMYILCFWFALDIGLKASRVSGLEGGAYIVWLSSGLIPWFFLQHMLGGGSDVFHKYAYLVSKLKFPVVLIPVFYELSGLLIHLMLLACLLVGYFAAGGALDVYLLQLPLIVIIMYCFSVGWSLMVSPLSALSKDVKNLIAALSTPIFWLSGVLFPISNINNEAIRIIAYFNPVTFITSSYRDILSVSGGKSWIWSDPAFFGIGMGVIVLTIVCGCIIYSKLYKDVPDVL
ncbi:MAG: ABC transporter permease [Coriobacteriales bacterium]